MAAAEEEGRHHSLPSVQGELLIIRHRKLTKQLSVWLTDSEIRSKQNDLIASHERERGLDVEMESAKAEVKRVKEAIAEERAHQNQLSKVASDRCEDRSVDCEELYDFLEGRVVVRRMDCSPGKVISSRLMSSQERQLVISQDASMIDESVRDAIDDFERHMGDDEDEAN